MGEFMQPKPETTIESLLALDIRVGTVLKVEDSPARKPSYKLTIDFGDPLGERISSAGVKPWYTPDELLGRQVVAVVNFPLRQVATVISEVLCLGAVDAEGRVRLLKPDEAVSDGEGIT